MENSTVLNIAKLVLKPPTFAEKDQTISVLDLIFQFYVFWIED